MNIDKFKKALMIRLILLSALCIGIIIFIIIQFTLLFYANYEHSEDYFMLGVRMGGGVGVMSVIVMNIVRYIIVFINKSQLQKMFISENDERKRYIEYKCGKFATECTLYLLCISIIVATFFNMIVFWTLYIVLVVFGLLKIGAKIYFNRKY